MDRQSETVKVICVFVVVAVVVVVILHAAVVVKSSYSPKITTRQKCHAKSKFEHHIQIDY